jgi:hypothetical protein
MTREEEIQIEMEGRDGFLKGVGSINNPYLHKTDDNSRPGDALVWHRGFWNAFYESVGMSRGYSVLDSLITEKVEV